MGKADLTSTHNLCFEQKYEKYQRLLSENFQFLEVKFSIFLDRRVFVMCLKQLLCVPAIYIVCFLAEIRINYHYFVVENKTIFTFSEAKYTIYQAEYMEKMHTEDLLRSSIW